MIGLANAATPMSRLVQPEKTLTINTDEQRMKELKARVMKDCRMLNPGRRPGWECGIGWTDALAKLSYRIECANQLFTRNFRVHAVAD